MESIAPVLAIAYFAAQYKSASEKAETLAKEKAGHTSRGDIGEVIRSDRYERWHRAPLVGAEPHVPIGLQDWTRVIPYRPLNQRQKWIKQSDLIRNAIYNSVEEMPRERFEKNIPKRINFNDWLGTGRFPAFHADRGKNDRRFFQNTKDIVSAQYATYTRPNLFIGGDI